MSYQKKDGCGYVVWHRIFRFFSLKVGVIPKSGHWGPFHVTPTSSPPRNPGIPDFFCILVLTSQRAEHLKVQYRRMWGTFWTPANKEIYFEIIFIKQQSCKIKTYSQRSWGAFSRSTGFPYNQPGAWVSMINFGVLVHHIDWMAGNH